MKKILAWIWKELLHVLPVFIFFFSAFVVINIVERHIFEKAGIAPYTLLEIFIAAALIAKILLVIDHVRLINLFQGRPLIWASLWKTFVYWGLTALIRILLRFAPFIIRGKSLEFDWDTFVWQMDWNLFEAVQVVYLMLFFLFVTIRELTQVIGFHKMRKLFFGF